MIALVVDGLACWRATRLWTRDTFLDPVRDRVIEAAYVNAGRAEMLRTVSDAISAPGGWSNHARKDTNPPRLAELATCPYCASVWLGFAFALGTVVAPRTTRRFAYALALSALASLLAKSVDG